VTAGVNRRIEGYRVVTETADPGTAMTTHSRNTDQYTKQDPTTQYGMPDTQGKEIEHPGPEGQMDAKPDHGEETYRGSGRLQGKKALITGGDSGIGRAVAIAFAREGADVAIVHLADEEEDARETTKWVEQAGRKALALPADLRDERQCRQLVEQVAQEFGQIDVLVNNAAYQMAQPGGLEDISTEQFDRVMKTNLYGMFWVTRAALEHMREGASIINSSSIQAYQPSPELLDYAMTKAAIVNFTKGLGQALAERGIRVNTVAPGPVWTPLIPATMPSEKVESFGQQVPLGRPAQPAELAAAYVFFASQESSYVTSQVLGVTGGAPLA
jgi:NAD(P)-dependent dehydrogenase (short-subunit alcohol dehydrogenase family)